MSFASDKLYNGYLRRNLPRIVSKVKVREIIVHLPCLTAHDRETIEAKRETNGNFDGMMLLLDCLKRRENWPEQFIDALEACEHRTIAAEMRAEYNALKGTNNSNPSSPPTTVHVRAHVHPAPSASDLPVSEDAGNNQAPVSPPLPTVETSTQPQTPPQQQRPAEEEAPKADSPPEPVPEPPQVEVPRPPSTPPPSPETTHDSQVNEAETHQEPEENSEPDVQMVENGEVSVDSVTTPPLAAADETNAPSCTDAPQIKVTTEEEEETSQSPAPAAQVDSTDASSFPIMTPEKPPVQDTTPPPDKIYTPVLQPEENSEPPAAKVVEISPQTEVSPPPSSPEPVVLPPVTDASLIVDDSVCLSKPGHLVSVLPQDHTTGPSTLPAPSAPVQPYSGDSGRLEISGDDVQVTVTVTPPPPPCQENGFATNHNEPEENHYESPCGSLERQEVLENVVRVSEEPSILNQDGQTAQIVNGELAKKDATTTSETPSTTTISSVSSKPSQPEPEPTPLSRSVNTKYILTAAGVGACALMVAWKFKH